MSGSSPQKKLSFSSRIVKKFTKFQGTFLQDYNYLNKRIISTLYTIWKTIYFTLHFRFPICRLQYASSRTPTLSMGLVFPGGAVTHSRQHQSNVMSSWGWLCLPGESHCNWNPDLRHLPPNINRQLKLSCHLLSDFKVSSLFLVFIICRSLFWLHNFNSFVFYFVYLCDFWGEYGIVRLFLAYSLTSWQLQNNLK